jgi:uncharacterized membrane protein
MTNDMINAAFEVTGALFVLNNCWTLYRDKLVRGVSLLTTMYFTSWGIWNVYFYPALGQRWSWIAGMCICTANILWIFLMLYYKRKEKIRTPNEFVATTGSAIDG